jgi:2-keto-4-pentenoate hydratase
MRFAGTAARGQSRPVPDATTDLTGDERVLAAAKTLSEAAAARKPCAPVRNLIGSDDVELAYAVQRVLTAARLRAGAAIVGRKIGLTSPTVQQQLGVDQPDFGVLLDDMRSASEVAVDRLLQPKIEAEVAFVLGADIDDPDATASSVRAAVDHAVAALEIVDSRIAGWDITFGDTVADNASSGLFILAQRRLGLDDFEPREVEMTLTLDGTVASTGRGDACLGDPLAALAWLARTVARFGEPLRAGEVVLSGALGPMIVVGPGSRIAAEIGPLGRVEASFTHEENS